MIVSRSFRRWTDLLADRNCPDAASGLSQPGQHCAQRTGKGGEL
jgi:hypothetical protein